MGWRGGREAPTTYRSRKGTTRAEDAQETPTQSHISPSILEYENQLPWVEAVTLSTRREDRVGRELAEGVSGFGFGIQGPGVWVWDSGFRV